MYRYLVRFFIVITFFTCQNLFAQTSTFSNPDDGRENDPYSKYGIGDLQNGNNTVLRGMGDITSAFENPYEVNSDNPASYGFLQKTTYEGGFAASARSVVGSTGGAYNTGTASFGYMNIGLPFNSHKIAICIGLKPISHTYYSLIDTINSSIGQTQRAYSGDGSINLAYLGIAYRHKGFSVGVNLGYMFGTIVNNTSVLSIDTSSIYRSYEAEFPYYNRINGIYWKGGVMWEHKLRDSDYVIRVGATFTMKQSVSERFYAYQIATYNFSDTVVNDTSSNMGLQKGKLTLPMSFSFGMMLAKTGKWSLGFDYTATQWSGFKSTPDTTMELGVSSNAFKASIGGEYTPNSDDIRNYFSRVTYRMGLYYGKDYLQINGTQLPYYGLTLGGTFPFKRSARNMSQFHGALEVGRLGSVSNGLLQETYVRFSLGLSFTDIWFIPRKYD